MPCSRVDSRIVRVGRRAGTPAAALVVDPADRRRRAGRRGSGRTAARRGRAGPRRSAAVAARPWSPARPSWSTHSRSSARVMPGGDHHDDRVALAVGRDRAGALGRAADLDADSTLSGVEGSSLSARHPTKVARVSVRRVEPRRCVGRRRGAPMDGDGRCIGRFATNFLSSTARAGRLAGRGPFVAVARSGFAQGRRRLSTAGPQTIRQAAPACPHACPQAWTALALTRVERRH